MEFWALFIFFGYGFWQLAKRLDEQQKHLESMGRRLDEIKRHFHIEDDY